MSDSLKDRLASHSGAFEGLLSLIPAKYYYEDDAKAQLAGTKAKDGPAPKTAVSAKVADADTDSGTSALDELKRREGQPLVSDHAMDDEDVPIYDDYGNQISGPREPSIQELLQAKARGEVQQSNDINANADIPQKPAGRQIPAGSKQVGNKRKKTEHDARPAPQAEVRSDADSSAASDSGTAVAQPELKSSETSEAVAKQPGVEAEAVTEQPERKASVESKQGISELRAKLAARISEMRARRKAPGSSAPGAPKNREELLAQRKQRLEQKQKTQSLKRKRDGNDASDDEAQGDDVGDGDAKLEEKLMFGQVEFNDGARLGRDLTGVEEKKRVKKRNAIDQLRVIESRKAKLAELEEEKKKQVTENSKWSRAILQSEGAKIRDDEKLLRKTLRVRERQKSKSAKAWRDRKETVSNDIAAREAKRDANIKAHREAKQLRLKGKKRKDHMKRAGFEGKRR